MSKVLYECNKCGKTFISNRYRDGLNCDKCKGTLMPLGYVDEFQNSINEIKAKIENADKQYMLNRPPVPGKQPKKTENIINVKLNLDTTEFESKLNKIEKKLGGINSLDVAKRLSKAALKGAEATLELEEAFNRVKKILDE
ncbi:non-transporter ABC protein [Clostridium botulinum]|uniref:non-transporter ABC protein n=1 Tax=Clostridium botulinum TaxID=1491 RepID=UPI0013F729E1|nr:non-transporter ABC protein [Clostridium botulinum]MBY6888775.1 non-transporter ABC protein [Clostridium botulinum]NFI47933.1 non-transporter ABC protein [Clostridium botulinum]NFJ91940.1 non-transporter ABC protein [Clostridium botulinum]NFO72161.1 non-transporter ABC protein [Clostridium botulinum]HBJ2609711.1 non-transporter ABC protein [Clostridium botulinum]